MKKYSCRLYVFYRHTWKKYLIQNHVCSCSLLSGYHSMKFCRGDGQNKLDFCWAGKQYWRASPISLIHLKLQLRQTNEKSTVRASCCLPFFLPFFLTPSHSPWLCTNFHNEIFSLNVELNLQLDWSSLTRFIYIDLSKICISGKFICKWLHGKTSVWLVSCIWIFFFQVLNREENKNQA